MRTTSLDSSSLYNHREEKQSKSLLVQALGRSSTTTAAASSKLQIPLDHHQQTPQHKREPSLDPVIPRHSDFTIPTSNVGWADGGTPPPDLLFMSSPPQQEARRSILGAKVETKYVKKYKLPPTAAIQTTMQSSSSSLQRELTIPKTRNGAAFYNANDDDENVREEQQSSSHFLPVPVIQHGHNNSRNLSDLTPPSSPKGHHQHREPLSPLTPHDSLKVLPHHRAKKYLKAHETIHAQSLLLGLAFLAIWSPQNCMAPNLTQMADEFHLNDAERDFYLGANVALATGVLSLPLSAGIGILADLVNRKHLFVATVMGGALASLATGLSRNYKTLFLARLLNGGCMSGSVPVAFSLLGDLFSTEERNAASSGLTAMMGIGIIAGQVYAGMVGSTMGWSHAFYMSSLVTMVCALLVMCLVQEPIRGGKEEVLQDMLRHGTRYERTLSWQGFIHAMHNNESNVILMWQGFFSSVPWGIIFVFLNDYLSQERGFSVPDATFLVFVFGLGCAAGGVLGGYWGQVIQRYNRSYLPLFMAVTTFLGIFPFVALLNGSFTNAKGFLAVFYSTMGGFIASLPSVNVRPCLINVNPPETRGAALTAANLIINLARGAGPSCITLMGAIWGVNRQFSFNVTLAFFWAISALQLVFLSRTLPKDQDAMETELALYAANQIDLVEKDAIAEDDTTIVSIEDRITSFDAGAARETVQFMRGAFREIGDEFRHLQCYSIKESPTGSSENLEENDDDMDEEAIAKRRELWKQQQEKQLNGDKDYPSENTPLRPTRLM